MCSQDWKPTEMTKNWDWSQARMKKYKEQPTVPVLPRDNGALPKHRNRESGDERLIWVDASKTEFIQSGSQEYKEARQEK